MSNRKRIIEYLKSIENESFLYENKKASFTWWCEEKENKHGVVGGYSIRTNMAGCGIPFSENEDINEIIEHIEKFLVIPYSKQLSLF